MKPAGIWQGSGLLDLQASCLRFRVLKGSGLEVSDAQELLAGRIDSGWKGLRIEVQAFSLKRRISSVGQA